MSVTIRLAKVGKKNAPSYKVVVANTRDKRTGKYLEVLGYYNPSMNPAQLKIDKEKVEKWKKKGAMTTKAIDDLLAGTYKYVKYAPGSKTAKEDTEQTEEKSE